MVLLPSSLRVRALGRLAAARQFGAGFAALVLSAALTACGGWWDDKPQAQAVTGTDQAGPAPTPITLSSNSLGDLEIDISGIGTKTPSAAVRWDEDTVRRRALAVSDGTDTKSNIQAATPVAGGLDLKVSSIGTIDVGGFRYLTATFLVRNAQSCSTPGTCPLHSPSVARTNVTFLAVIGSTIPGTPFSRFLRQDDSPAAPALAAQLLPSHGMAVGPSGAEVDPSLASMQLFRESELPASAAPTELLPYGYVVSHVNGNSRTLPASPAADQFDGWVTFGYRIPLQTNSADNPFKMTLRLRAVEDSNTRVTQSLEEANFSGDLAVEARAKALGATTDIVVPCGRTSQLFKGNPICGARVAGSVGSPTTYFEGAPPATLKVVSTPSNRNNAPLNAAIVVGTSAAMNPPAATTLVVDGSMSGRRTLTGAFAGVFDGGTTANPNQLIFKLGATDKPFFRGERVSFTATAGNTSTGSAALQAFTGSFNTVGSAPGGTGGFAAAVSFGVGTGPLSVAVGDVNGDGRLDIVAANSNGASVSVLLGDGAGGFAPAANFTAPGGPISVALGDVNGDGRLDIITANISGSNVSVLLGDGAGGFGPAANFAVGSFPKTVVLGDVNGDGRLDIITANGGGSSLWVLLGNGSGGFATAVNIALASAPYTVALGDVNGDGRLDIISTVSSGQVLVLLGDGTGGFVPAGSFAVGATPSSVALGDVNGDGRLDIVTANNSSTTASVLLGDGAGGFAAAVNFVLGGSPQSVVLGDVNGDGHLDIITTGSNTVSVLRGNGAGGFSAPANYAVGTTAASVVLGDVDGDGRLDFITVNSSINKVSVLRGQ